MRVKVKESALCISREISFLHCVHKLKPNHTKRTEIMEINNTNKKLTALPPSSVAYRVPRSETASPVSEVDPKQEEEKAPEEDPIAANKRKLQELMAATIQANVPKIKPEDRVGEGWEPETYYSEVLGCEFTFPLSKFLAKYNQRNGITTGRGSCYDPYSHSYGVKKEPEKKRMKFDPPTFKFGGDLGQTQADDGAVAKKEEGNTIQGQCQEKNGDQGKDESDVSEQKVPADVNAGVAGSIFSAPSSLFAAPKNSSWSAFQGHSLPAASSTSTTLASPQDLLPAACSSEVTPQENFVTATVAMPNDHFISSKRVSKSPLGLPQFEE